MARVLYSVLPFLLALPLGFVCGELYAWETNPFFGCIVGMALACVIALACVSDRVAPSSTGRRMSAEDADHGLKSFKRRGGF